MRKWHDKEIVINGLKFHYLDWGDDTSKPFDSAQDEPLMLLLHGGAQDGHSWDEFSERMQDKYHVIAFEQRGHGDSDWADDPMTGYTREAHFGDISGFVDALDLPPLILLGLSMGGQNAAYFTARRREKVRALVIVDSGPEFSEEGAKELQRFAGIEEFDSFEDAVEKAHNFNPHRPIEQLRERLGYRLRQGEDGKWRPKHDMRHRTEAIQKEMERRSPEEAWEDLKKITCPTLVIRGAESKVLMAETAQKMSEVMSNCKTVDVEKAGHTVPGDNPEGFFKAVSEWLGEHE